MGGSQNYGPFLGPFIIRHLIFRGPKRNHNFDNHPHVTMYPSVGAAADPPAGQGWSRASAAARLSFELPSVWSSDMLYRDI